MRRIPHAPLDQAFVRAVRTSGYTLVTLAALADYAAHTQLSGHLNARQVPLTARTVARLAAVARAIAYSGPVFVETRSQQRNNAKYGQTVQRAEGPLIASSARVTRTISRG